MKVLVTSCTNNSSLVAMRALHRDGLEIVGVDERRLPFGLHSNCAAPYEIISSMDSPGFVDRLVRVINKHRPDVLLPFGAALQASQAKEVLCRSTNLLIPDFNAFVALNDKRMIVEQCKQNGILSPELLDLEDARNKLQRGLIEAVVVKPRLNLGGGEGVTIITNSDELDQAVTAVEKRFGEALVMEFIPGPDSDNIALQVVFDRSSRPIGYFSMRKTRLYPSRIGIAAAAVSIHRSDLLALIKPLFARLQWQGPADIEFKIDSRTGDIWLIEVNGRFSGAVGFAISCGVNLPLLACKASLGENLHEATAPEFRAGVKYWNPVMYSRAIMVAAFMGKSRAGLPSQIVHELRGERVGNPYRISDPAPLIGKGLYQIWDWIRATHTRDTRHRINK